ncbi:MAG: HAMP domain-containing sensor histidine kinase, partial [Rhodoferax sp.]|nr:HAMP domain-containing sensor histidine kinase [Rhodoferax sp.]
QLEETVRQTNQMLALARVDSAGLKMDSVNVSELAEKTTRQWWSAAREQNIDLGFEPDAEPLCVMADAALLQEALSNLLHNALRYTPRGGQVTVKLTHSGCEVAISVIDNGPGMPMPERAHAGDRFYRGSNASLPGTGLGLAIVRSIAERHGGELRLGSAANEQGFVASVVLPRRPTTG